MIDNTHVVVLRGTGREMIPLPEMEAFAERLQGSASSRLAQRRLVLGAWNGWYFPSSKTTFRKDAACTSWQDLNLGARQWSRQSQRNIKHLRRAAQELFAIEQLHLKPLPRAIPKFTGCISARWTWKVISR